VEEGVRGGGDDGEGVLEGEGLGGCSSVEGDEEELALVDPHAVGVVFGAEPVGEDLGGFDEEELAVGVKDADPELGKGDGQLSEQVDNQPLVFDIVSVAGGAVEIGETCGS